MRSAHADRMGRAAHRTRDTPSAESRCDESWQAELSSLLGRRSGDSISGLKWLCVHAAISFAYLPRFHCCIYWIRCGRTLGDISLSVAEAQYSIPKRSCGWHSRVGWILRRMVCCFLDSLAKYHHLLRRQDPRDLRDEPLSSSPPRIVAANISGASIHLQPTQEGNSVAYVRHLDGADNLWVNRLDGSAPYRITDFSSDQIGAFSFSPDGKRLAILRSHRESDVVLLQETKK